MGVGVGSSFLFPVPCSLFPVPCSLFPAPCSLLPAPKVPHLKTDVNLTRGN
ncbi:hypothetical protein [Moorena sp. SIO3H5]|uniref:hypothetical protein n=1 Tax=Moorena sp. SIO3H5 TaxID=2607834 RepID=UPI0013B9AE7F|nr:hypothetical protein [Moorena sp. SIO3H5]NEO72644.1 hypothetical protein [Moorena sp. SIO3H5]